MIQVRNTAPFEYSNSQQAIKLNNTMLVFNIVRDHMPISRAELAKISPLSSSTISNLVEDLIKDKWLIETDTLQTLPRGRRSIMLEVNASMGCVAVVALLSRGFILTLYDICLQKKASVRLRSTLYDSDIIKNTILTLLRDNNIGEEKLLGIHLIFPGVVDSSNGDLVRSVIIPEEEIIDKHLVSELKNYFENSHVMISSNGTIIAFEEFINPESDIPLPLLSLNVDEAIFGGVVLSDESSDLNFCIPLELGHIIIDHGGKECKCGNHGCLETLCSTPLLMKTLNERAGTTLSYSEDFGAECNVTSMEFVAKRLAEGDSKIEMVIKDFANTLCSALTSVINLLHIKSIRIGGDIALLGEPFLKILQNTMNERFFPLNNSYEPQINLFVSDYEQVRLAATIMCLDVLFSK